MGLFCPFVTTMSELTFLHNLVQVTVTRLPSTMYYLCNVFFEARVTCVLVHLCAQKLAVYDSHFRMRNVLTVAIHFWFTNGSHFRCVSYLLFSFGFRALYEEIA